MLNNQEEINKIIPDMYVKNIYEIDFKKLKKYKYLLFDIDNTIALVDDINVEDKLIKLFKKLKKDYTILLISNNGEKRVKPVADKLDVKYLYNSGKPKKEAFTKAMKKLNAKNNNTIMIGDQMMSDIKGAKESNIFTIMTDPLSNKHNIKTKTSRIIQNIIEKHLEKNKKFKHGCYYKERDDVI